MAGRPERRPAAVHAAISADRSARESGACRAVSAPGAGRSRRRKADRAAILALCPGSPPYGAQRARPRARRPSSRTMGTLPEPDRLVYTKWLRDARAGRSVGLNMKFPGRVGCEVWRRISFPARVRLG